MRPTPVKPLYVLHGQDEFLRDRHRRRIVSQITGEADRQLAVADFDSSAELSAVLDELRTAPLLAPHRAVVVRDADRFVTAHARALASYVSSPSASGTLVLLVSSWKSTSRAKAELEAFAAMDKLARKAGEFVNCSAPKESELPRYIERFASRRGKQVSRDAAALLAAWTGADLGRLDGELEKLALYVGQRERIVIEDVGAVVVATTSPAPFALPDAIAAGRVSQALTELAALMTARGQEFRVLGLIAWQLRRRLGTGGRTRGRPPRTQVQFRDVLAADLAIKTGADPLTTMQMLVTKLCL